MTTQTEKITLKEAIAGLKTMAGSLDEADNGPAVLEAIDSVMAAVEAGEVEQATKDRLAKRYLRLADEAVNEPDKATRGRLVQRYKRLAEDAAK